MNISLTPQLQRLVEDKVASGLYHSASEVIREGLRLLQERDQLRQVRLEELRQQIQVGLDELDQGLVAPLDTDSIKQRGRKRLAERQKKAQ